MLPLEMATTDPSCTIPARQTSASGAASSSWIRAKADLTWVSLETSATISRSARSDSGAEVACAMSTDTVVQPTSRRHRIVPRPSPPAPPVTTTIRLSAAMACSVLKTPQADHVVFFRIIPSRKWPVSRIMCFFVMSRLCIRRLCGRHMRGIGWMGIEVPGGIATGHEK